MTLSFQSMKDAVHLRICLCKVVLKIGEDRSLEDYRRCMCMCVCGEISILCLTFHSHESCDFSTVLWPPMLESPGSVRRIRLSKDPNNKDRSPSGTSNLHGSCSFVLGFFWKKLRTDFYSDRFWMYRLYCSSWSKTVFCKGVLRIGWNWKLRNDGWIEEMMTHSIWPALPGDL